MSRLDELIKELCPDGVEYKMISDISNVSIGEFVKKDKQTENGQYPVFNGGTSNTGFYDDFNRNENKIIISARGANAGFVNRVFTKFWSGNSCYTIDVTDKNINWTFVYYWLKNNERKLLGEQQTGSIPAVSKKQVCEFKLPVPPLEIQEEIVKILDKFTDYVTELQAELHLREIQYEELAYRLLIEDVSGEKYKLSEICDVVKGKTPIQKAVPGEYPLVVTKAERGSSDTYQFDAKAVCIPLISSRGHGVASLNHVYYQEGKFALGNILCAVIPTALDIVSPKYLYYYFECTKDYTLVPLMKGGANVAMTVADVANVKVTIPNIKAQNEVITKLIALEEYVNEVLPAEIELRQKQYEYYRDKLLSFKEIEL